MKKILLLIILLLFTLPVLAQNTILVIGDSLSAGYGIDVTKGWVALLQKRLNEEKYNYRVVNASISGNTTSNGLARTANALAAYHPSITIIELGGNDGLRGIPLTTIQANLAKMIEQAKTAKSEVLLLGLQLPPNYGVEYTQGFQKIFSDLSQQYQTQVVPLFLHNIDIDVNLMQADRIHPTAQAQSKLLDNVWPTLKNMLQKP